MQIIDYNDILTLVTDDRVKIILEEIKNNFIQGANESGAIEQSFLVISGQLQSFLNELIQKNQLYQNAYNSQILTNTHYKTIKQIEKEKFGEELIVLLEQGYILLQGIREEMVGDAIDYNFIKQYSGKTISYHMNLQQLLQYTRKEKFSTYTGNVASLAITMKGLIKYLNEEIQGEELSKDPLFNSVMSKMGKVYEHGRLEIKSNDTLVESYYQLRNIGFNTSAGNKLTKGVIYFYKMTQGQIPGYKGNLSQTQGGDSFLTQIKYNAKKTTTFNLIDINFLINGLKSLITTFSGPFDKNNLFENLSKQFIQPLGPSIKQDMADYMVRYSNQLNNLINQETEYLKNKIFSL